MPLVDLTTSLKSLKFGKDRPYGGSSNQPYIQSSIPEGESSGFLQTGGPDFILRGGALAPINAVKDVSRLTQMFADIKSPNGLLFASKQNTLSKTSVKTEASTGINYALGLNQGVYLPTSTIAQAGVGFLGTHLNLFGLIPTNDGIIKYEDVIKESNNNSKNYNPFNNSGSVNNKLNPEFNRLLQLWGNNQVKKNETGILYSYSGGPGSILGLFGNTNIKFSNQRTNVNTQFGGEPFSNNNKSPLKSFYYTSEQIATSLPSSLNLNSDITEDFRATLIKSNNINESTVLSISPSYLSRNNKTIETRTHLGDPAKHLGNPEKFSKDILHYGLDAKTLIALDKINALPMYDGEGPNGQYAINDLVKFRIAAINNDKNGRQAVYMHFRAFIDSFDDNYSATWNPIKYSGRGDTLYNYQGFERSINLSFTVYAQSKAELIPMYRKLNYLASTLAPDYNEAGFMRGNLLRLTLGGYLYEQPGFITSLTYNIPEESTWEIGIDEDGNSDDSVKELPHMIKITGMTFVPIHTFLPQKPNSDSFIQRNSGKYEPIPEKYIALSAGNPSLITYTNYGDNYQYYDAVNNTSPYIPNDAPKTSPSQPLTTDNSTATPASDILNIPNSPNSFFS